MDFKLTPLSAVLERADNRLRSPDSGVRLWPTGFPLLDEAIGGGLRSGTLNLIAGPQGQGKTMFALQAARAAVKAGRSAVFFSYELEADALTQRLIAMECGEIDQYEAPSLSEVRAIFEGTSGGAGGLIERMAATRGGIGTQALLNVSEYADRLVVHRSTATHTDITEMNDTVKKVMGSTGEAPLIVVDYLQKVATPLSELGEEERITRITEQLKDVAIEFDTPGARRRRDGPRGSRARRPDADPPHARLDGPVLRARRRPDPRHQVRPRGAPPPDVRRRERRELQGLVGRSRSRRTGPAAAAPRSSSASASTRAASSRTATSSPRSSSTSASTSSSSAGLGGRGLLTVTE